MTRFSLAMLVSAPLFGSVVLAQDSVPSFDGLKLNLGQQVFVTDLISGKCTLGYVRALDSAAIEFDHMRIVPAAGLQIKRKGDSLWNGAVIGFLAGFAIRGGQGCGTTKCGLFAGLVYAGLGVAFDFGREGFTTVYKTAVPSQIAPAAKLQKCPP